MYLHHNIFVFASICITTFRPVNVLQEQWRTRGEATNAEEYSRVLRNVCMIGKLTRCVTCKVY